MTGWIKKTGPKKMWGWELAVGGALTASSAVLFIIQLVIFGSARDTFFYLLQDVAFLPVQALFVSVFIDRLLNAREKRAMMEKLNMAIGIFFSEAGTGLLRSLSSFGPQGEVFTTGVVSLHGWDEKAYALAKKRVIDHAFTVACTEEDLVRLKAFLLQRKAFLLALLQNPNLLEHDSFTELLRAVFHLVEEMECRPDLKGLTRIDHKHLEGDIKRAYGYLVLEWLAYMRYLSREYPYLFSLSARMNPFDPKATAEVRE